MALSAEHQELLDRIERRAKKYGPMTMGDLMDRLEGLEAALIEAKVCIVNFSDQKELDRVAPFLLTIDRALGNSI